MLDRTMSANKLCGNVAQTHFTIQTAVAYLSSLLFKRKQSLIVYGAADRYKYIFVCVIVKLKTLLPINDTFIFIKLEVLRIYKSNIIYLKLGCLMFQC